MNPHMPRVDPSALAAQLISGALCREPDGVEDAEQAPAGAVLGWASPTGEIELGVAGNRSLAGDPTDAATLYDLASVTKLFTTAAVMCLVSGGHVGLDDPVDHWLPLPSPVPTVRDLLRHRGGLQPWQPLYLQAGDRPGVLNLITRLPRLAPPDVERSYSDLGFMLLGFMIEEVTGSPLADALDDLIMKPLGLTVAYGPTHAPVAGSALDDRVEMRMVATGDPYPILLDGSFDGWRRRPVVGEVNDCNAHHALGGISGHAGLFSTIRDLVHFGQALGEPTHGLWRPETLAEFTTAGPDPQQALGFRLRELPGGGRLIWHPGFTGTALGVVSGHDQATAVVAMMTNRLLVTGQPLSTERLWLHVLAGTGLLPA